MFGTLLAAAVAASPMAVPISIDSALAELRGERLIVDMTWQGVVKVLYIGMRSDGTRRDGYAQYVCEVLRAHHAHSGATVRIIDAATIRDGVSSWRRMGEARC